MNEFVNKLVMKFDPDYGQNVTLQVGDTVDTSFSLLLTGNRTIQFSDLITRGPVLLVFIKGTWCPFCRLHLQRLRQWSESIGQKATTVVVSSEDIETISKWLKSNPVTYIFASDVNGNAAKKFNVWLEDKNFSQASTFLVDVDHKIKFVFTGKRDKGEEELMPRI